MERIETDTKGGELKYLQLLKTNGGFKLPPKDYITFFRALALTLTGQYTGDYYSDFWMIDRMQVDYSKRVNVDLRGAISNFYITVLGKNEKYGN